MKLILDCRESNLLKSCEGLIKTIPKFKHIKLTTENLLIGDMAINDDENNNVILFERKTIADLLASIKDGRYREQSYRLSGSEYHNHNIIYLIEGTLGKFDDKQIVYSSIFSLNYFKGFSVFRSYNIDETAYILCNAFVKLEKEKGKQPYYSNNKLTGEITTTEGEEKSYSTVIKMKKNANITKENFGEIVLCQIPSISSTTAVAIMKEFKTIDNLIEKLKEDRKCLNEVSYETEKKQKRKISKTSIQNILEFLL
jgi:ERCC4-type nuclease